MTTINDDAGQSKEWVEGAEAMRHHLAGGKLTANPYREESPAGIMWESGRRFVDEHEIGKP